MSVRAAAVPGRSAAAALDGSTAWLVPHEAAGSLVESFAAWADHEERARAARFTRVADRAAYAISHAALRLVLGAATDQPPAAVRFARLPGGKPVLAGADDGPSFSLSHTTGATLIAVARCAGIGADIEATPAELDAERLLMAIASVEEAAQLRATTAPGVLALAVLRLWVVKEAALKLDGVGLALDPRRVVAEEHAPDMFRIRATAGLTVFAPRLVRVLDVGDGCSAAAALSMACEAALIAMPVIRWPGR